MRAVEDLICKRIAYYQRDSSADNPTFGTSFEGEALRCWRLMVKQVLSGTTSLFGSASITFFTANGYGMVATQNKNKKGIPKKG